MRPPVGKPVRLAPPLRRENRFPGWRPGGHAAPPGVWERALLVLEGKCPGARTNCAVCGLVLGSPTPPGSIVGEQHLRTSRSPTRRRKAVVGATMREAEQELSCPRASSARRSE